jgi:hypothetical protein
MTFGYIKSHASDKLKSLIAESSLLRTQHNVEPPDSARVQMRAFGGGKQGKASWQDNTNQEVGCA